METIIDMDPLALWGALTGTAGTGVALRRELIAGRRRLAVQSSVRLITSRIEPMGEILSGFACVGFWNTGGHTLAVERVGFRIPGEQPDGGLLREMRAEIQLEVPIEAKVDGPSHKIFTPLGPLLAAGVDPFDLLEAFAVTTGDRDWSAPLQPLIFSTPPTMSAEQLATGLAKLREGADRPPIVGNQIALKPVRPILPEDEIEED